MRPAIAPGLAEPLLDESSFKSGRARYAPSKKERARPSAVGVMTRV